MEALLRSMEDLAWEIQNTPPSRRWRLAHGEDTTPIRAARTLRVQIVRLRRLINHTLLGEDNEKQGTEKHPPDVHSVAPPP